jgi:glutamate N-acetyltransferase/amino-acid N-acetyltransferase
LSAFFIEEVDMSNNVTLHPVSGVYLGATAAGIKKNGKLDLVVMEFYPESVTAAVFTQNAFCAAPVTVAKAHLVTTQPRALVINSGNANAGTGKQGLADAKQTCAWVAEELGCDVEAVLPFSTGVIGENLPMEKIQHGLPDAIANLNIEDWLEANQGIMTTDTVEKLVSVVKTVGGKEVVFTGMSKGSGMIHPNMATMLGFVATDARITPACLQLALDEAVNVSFNRITVDGDTSTNDACTVTATQQAEMPLIEDPQSPEFAEFSAHLKAVMVELAQKIVRDGEGATKFVAVNVLGGESSEACLKVAHAVALSPLVKTALFASDPNWGRILAAVGRAGLANLNIDLIEIYLGDVCIVRDGGRAPDYTEEAGQAVMNQDEITITIKLRRGDVNETVWTTDLSYDYVKINAEYRT